MRTRVPRALLVLVLLVALLAFYLALLGVRGISLLGDPRPAVKGLGLGIVLLPVIGVAILVTELRFGRDAARLGKRLADEGGLPPDDEPAPPAGRRDYARADAVFAERRAEVERDPDDWRSWYRLGRAYGDAGDVVRGRRAVRRAIALERRCRS